MRGPNVCRGALWEASGVSNAGSAGNLDVKTLDFGKSARDIVPAGVTLELVMLLLLVVERWDAIWPSRIRVVELSAEVVDMYRDRPVQARSIRAGIAGIEMSNFVSHSPDW